jgi:hypothetical protein
VRTECLDWVLIWNRRHLERVLTDYIRHYNTARPHRGIDLDVPRSTRWATPDRARRRSGVSNGSTCSAALSTNTATPPDQRRQSPRRRDSTSYAKGVCVNAATEPWSPISARNRRSDTANTACRMPCSQPDTTSHALSVGGSIAHRTLDPPRCTLHEIGTRVWATRAEARQAVFAYIVYYNQHRLRSTLKRQTPYEARICCRPPIAYAA